MRCLALCPAALLALCTQAHAQFLTVPGVFTSGPMTPNMCVQATGINSVGTTSVPCATGTGTGGITGPASSTIGALVAWGNATGTAVTNTTVLAANIPQLGASQTWGGVNTFNMRPVFAGGATPWDSLNFNPADYLTTTTAAATYETQAHAASTYLTQTGAQQTYATISGVQSAYLRISDAASTYAPLVSPALTGNPTAPTPATSDNDTSIATTALVTAKVSAATVSLAPLASPAFTGTPTAPTPLASDNSTKLATTAYVTAAVSTANQQPYFIRVDFQGPANAVLGANGFAMHYVFSRNVTCPDHFFGSGIQRGELRRRIGELLYPRPHQVRKYGNHLGFRPATYRHVGGDFNWYRVCPRRRAGDYPKHGRHSPRRG